MPNERSKVLVVDDEDLIVDLLVHAFEEAGFEVATAGNAREAAKALQGGGGISLVVTDISMPGVVDGLLFGHMVVEAHPAIPVIIISGASHPDEGDVPSGARFIAKPFSPALLIREARQLLAERAGA
jgi:DNA-binding NtrC family response regulator